MEKKLSSVARTFTPSPIQQLSHLAQSSNAINLAEGFPDFPAPSEIKLAGVSAIVSDFNQYRHVHEICDRLAELLRDVHGLEVDPLTDIAICCGQTAAFMAAIFASDEVIIFDPAYETYGECISLAGGIPVYVSLDPPQWTLDTEKFMKSFTTRTKAVVLNSPQNPTGKVFSLEELEVIAEACRKTDCLAITDETYEYITYDQVKHISLATLPGMQERTIITSSLSKTYSVTGWRIGWAIAPTPVASALKNIHVKMVDSAPAPFQEAALTALRSQPQYYETLIRDYEAKRNFTIKLLSEIGFQIKFMPQGSSFVFAELPEKCLLTDIEYVESMIEKAGVVAVPGCEFFHSNTTSENPEEENGNYDYRKRYIRFAFCKSDATLGAAAQKLRSAFLVDGFWIKNR